MSGQPARLDEEQVRHVLLAAGRAPSTHNTQPWLFRADGDTIEVLADPRARLPVVDPDDRELRISCGAALFNLRVALRSLAHEARTTLLPDPQRPDLLARVTVLPATSEWPGLTELYQAIWRRSTHRMPLRTEQVPMTTRRALHSAAGAEQAALLLVDDPEQRAAVRDLVREAHAQQQADPAFRAEFDAWSGFTEPRGRGVPAQRAGPPPEPQDEWPMRDFGGGHALPRTPGKDYESEPLVAVLLTAADLPVHQLRAGQALQYVLLTATMTGLGASFLNQPVELPAYREKLRVLLGGLGHPQIVLRLGFGSPMPPSPRLALDDVLAPGP